MCIENKVSLYLGDCIEVLKTLPDNSIDLVLTDPPYGTTSCKWDNIIPFEEMWLELKRVTKETTPVLLFGVEPFSSILRISNVQDFKYDWIWEKTTPTGHFNAKKQPMRAHEIISVFYSKQCLYNPQKTTGHKPVNSFTKHLDVANKTELYGKSSRVVTGGGNTDRYPRSIQVFKSDKQKVKLHPTQKPVELLEYLILTYTNKGDIVLDFTMGSGSTGVACINTERKFIGIELEEKYFNIAKDRLWSKNE